MHRVGRRNLKIRHGLASAGASRPFLCSIALGCLFVLVVAACAGDDSEEGAETTVAATTASRGVPEATVAATTIMVPESLDQPAEEMAEATGDGSAGAALAMSTASIPADYGRDVIYRATISVQAPDVAAATRDAVAIVQGLGGIVFGQEIRTRPAPSSVITFKVLPQDFSTALERLAGVGELVDQQISADDVTERIVDFESRIITAEASVLRLRKFLEEATDLENVALLERELLNRETDLETLRGQLRTLEDQVGLATITLTIFQLPAVVPETGMSVAAWVSTDPDDPCLGSETIVVEPEATVHFCLEIENTGELALADVRVRSETLRLRSDAAGPTMNTFTPIQGNFDRIEPGEWLVATLSEPVTEGRLAGRVAARGLDIVFEVAATPVDPDGAELLDLVDSYWVFVHVEEDDTLSFPSAIRAGADALVAAARFVAVVVGVLLPFTPVIALVGGLVLWIRRRRRHSSGRLPRRVDQ